MLLPPSSSLRLLSASASTSGLETGHVAVFSLSSSIQPLECQFMATSPISVWRNRPRAVDLPPAAVRAANPAPSKESFSDESPSTETSPDRPQGTAAPIDSARLSALLPHRQLSPSIRLVPIDGDLLPQFRALVSSLLPVDYPPSFYDDTIRNRSVSAVSWAAVETINGHDKMIAAIRAVLEPGSSRDRFERILHVSTITTDPSWQGHGVGANLVFQAVVAGETYLQREKDQQTKTGPTPRAPGWTLTTANTGLKNGERLTPLIKKVTARVWCRNDGALRFYHRLGFRRVAELEDYYTGISPRTAILVERRLT